MNQTQHMIDILTAKQQGRAIETRRRNGIEGDSNPWIDLSKDDALIDFRSMEYRLAPINTECWLVYDHDNGEYVFDVFPSASLAAAWIVGRVGNPPTEPNRYEPIKMVPARREP